MLMQKKLKIYELTEENRSERVGEHSFQGHSIGSVGALTRCSGCKSY